MRRCLCAGRARCSPPIPRCPPGSTGSARSWWRRSSATSLTRTCRPTGSWPLAPRPFRAAIPTCSTWPSWACGWRSASTASAPCTGRSAGRCSPACGPASTPRRCRSVRLPTVCTAPPGWRRRSCAWRGAASRRNSPRTRPPGSARRTMMLHDPERLIALLLDPDRPLQIVIAGKAHPADDGGKLMIQQMVRFADDPRVRHRIVFLPDYDMALAGAMVQGCDVWLNNPLRPLEACGTSGMKAALNGALNLSILDGWWDEWFDGHNGWAIPSADGVADPERRDELEASALYDLLGQSVGPLFYDRGPDGLPGRWLEMVAHTLRTLGPKAQATSMVREYVTQLYLPAARSSQALADGGPEFAGARELAEWKDRVTKAWPGVAIEHVEADDGEQSPGANLVVRASVALGGLSPDDVTVQVVYGPA